MLTKSSNFRGWFLLNGASPLTNKQYIGRAALQAPSQSYGGRSYEHAALPGEYGDFNYGFESRLPKADAEFGLLVRSNNKINPFKSILEDNIAFDYQATIGRCKNPTDYSSWEKIIIFEDCIINSISYEGTESLSRGDVSVTNQKLNINAQNMYEVRKLSYSTPVEQEDAFNEISLVQASSNSFVFLRYNNQRIKTSLMKGGGEKYICSFSIIEDSLIDQSSSYIVKVDSADRNSSFATIYVNGLDPFSSCNRIVILENYAEITHREYDSITDTTKYKVSFLRTNVYTAEELVGQSVSCSGVDCTALTFDPVWISKTDGAGTPVSFELAFDLSNYSSTDFLHYYQVTVTHVDTGIQLLSTKLLGENIQLILPYSLDDSFANYICDVSIEMESAAGCQDTILCAGVDLAVDVERRICAPVTACDFFEADIYWVLSEWTTTTLAIEDIILNWGQIVDYRINVYDAVMSLDFTVLSTEIPKVHILSGVAPAVNRKVEFVVTNDRGCSYTLLCDPVDTNNAFVAINCNTNASPCAPSTLTLIYTYDSVTGNLVFQNPNSSVGLYRVSVATEILGTPYHTFNRINPQWPIQVPPDTTVMSGTGTGQFTAITYDGCYYVINCTGLDFSTSYSARNCTEVYGCLSFSADILFKYTKTASGFTILINDVTLVDSPDSTISSIKLSAFAETDSSRIDYFNNTEIEIGSPVIYVGPVLSSNGELTFDIETPSGCLYSLTCLVFDFNDTSDYSNCAKV